MESDTQKAFGELCAEIGMSMSAVFSIFAKKSCIRKANAFFLDIRCGFRTGSVDK